MIEVVRGISLGVQVKKADDQTDERKRIAYLVALSLDDIMRVVAKLRPVLV